MPSPALESAWRRLKTSAEKVIDAGDKLDDAGGLRRLAAPWTRVEKTKARAVLMEAIQVLKGQLAMLNSGPAAGRAAAPEDGSPIAELND